MLPPLYVIEYHSRYVEVRPGYERVNNRDHAWWKTLADICTANNCYQVLSDAELFPAAMTLFDAFETAIAATPILLRVNLAICIGVQPATESLSFFQTVASNRGASVEAFSHRKEALDWLLKMADRRLEYGDSE